MVKLQMEVANNISLITIDYKWLQQGVRGITELLKEFVIFRQALDRFSNFESNSATRVCAHHLILRALEPQFAELECDSVSTYQITIDLHTATMLLRRYTGRPDRWPIRSLADTYH